MLHLFDCFKRRPKSPLLLPDPSLSPLTSPSSIVDAFFVDPPAQEPETLVVLALDADGVVFNPIWVKYMQSSLKNKNNYSSIFLYNKPLVSYIQEILGQYDVNSAVVMVGSMRQSLYADNYNTQRISGTGSYFFWLEQFCKHFNEEYEKSSFDYRLELNRYLLSDTHSDTAHGFSYFNSLADQGYDDLALIETQCKSDQSKLMILYAQMFKMATENKDKKIVYRFVDDHQDTLDVLDHVFRQNRVYLPPNLSVEMVRHYYDSAGNPVLDRARGIIEPYEDNIMDDCYEETVKKIAEYISNGKNVCFDVELQKQFQLYRLGNNTLRSSKVLIANDIDILHSLRKEVESLYADLLEHYFNLEYAVIADCMDSVFLEIRILYHIYIKESARSSLEYSFEAMNDFSFMKLILSYVKNLLEGRFEHGLVSGCSQSNIENIVKGKMGPYNTASLAYALNTLYNIIVFPTAPLKENLTPGAY